MFYNTLIKIVHTVKAIVICDRYSYSQFKDDYFNEIINDWIIEILKINPFNLCLCGIRKQSLK